MKYRKRAMPGPMGRLTAGYALHRRARNTNAEIPSAASRAPKANSSSGVACDGPVLAGVEAENSR